MSGQINGDIHIEYIYNDDLLHPDAYKIHYPEYVFPNKCVVCGSPSQAFEEQEVKRQRVISKQYVNGNSAIQTKYANVSMKVRFPLCNIHKQESRKKQTGSQIFLALGGGLGIALTAWVLSTFTGLFTSDTGLAALISFFGGGVVGMTTVGVMMLVFDKTREAKGLSTNFSNKFGLFLTEDNVKNPWIRVAVRIDNDEILQETLALTNAKRYPNAKLP